MKCRARPVLHIRISPQALKTSTLHPSKSHTIIQSMFQIAEQRPELIYVTFVLELPCDLHVCFPL